MRRGTEAGAGSSSASRAVGRGRRGATKVVPSRFRGGGGGGEGGSGSAEGQDWERVMHTKLTQWRYMHLVALDELSTAERGACAQIADLAAVQEASASRLHNMGCVLADARAARADEQFAQRAGPALARLRLALAAATPAHDEVCSALVAALRRLRVPTGAVGAPERLPARLHAFRGAADAFVEAARRANVPDATGAAAALAQLERVAVSMQQDALAAAAKHVADAADAIDNERASRAASVLAKEGAARPTRSPSARASSLPRAF